LNSLGKKIHTNHTKDEINNSTIRLFETSNPIKIEPQSYDHINNNNHLVPASIADADGGQYMLDSQTMPISSWLERLATSAPAPSNFDNLNSLLLSSSSNVANNNNNNNNNQHNHGVSMSFLLNDASNDDNYTNDGLDDNNDDSSSNDQNSQLGKLIKLENNSNVFFF
jgi:hypothetical protein